MKKINTENQSIAARWRTFMRGHVVLQVCVTILTTGYSHFALATTYYVDQANANCLNTGPGTQVTPFCRISAGAAVTVAGDTVEVASGTYPEQVTITRSGSDQGRVVYKAADNATVAVQGQAYGFRLLSVSYVTVQGFTTQNNSANGIYMSQCFNCKILNNHVTLAGQQASGLTQKGIYVGNSTNSLIEGNLVNFNTDSGIYVVNGSTGITIKNNTLHNNARGYMRAAPGIEVRSNSNTIVGNISFDNEDSGIQLYQGASNNIVVNNACYDNGDHGIDISSSPGNIVVGNTIARNATSGINVEGTDAAPAINTKVANNISIDNALNTDRTKGNIRVDSRSDPGTTIDYDLMYLSQSGVMIVWDGLSYSSLAEMQAAVPAQEIDGIEAFPHFLNPGADDFHLTPLSPATDSANSGANGARDTDLEGNPRVDYTSVGNSGVGQRDYDDRGAYEYQTSGITLTLNPVADATIKAGLSAGSNFGTNSTLEVAKNNSLLFSSAKDSLIKFTVTGVGARTVTRAVLRFYCVNPSNNGGSIYRVANNSWLESTVTWNNAPVATQPPIASLGPVTLNTWVQADVTSYITGDGTYSMRIISPSTDGAVYPSRQDPGFKPELVLLAE